MVVELLEDIGDVVIAIDYVELREIVISVYDIFRSCLNGTKKHEIHKFLLVSLSLRQTRS